MQKLMRRRIPNWLMLAIGMSFVVLALGVSALNKPLPEYLVASEDLVPGRVIDEEAFISSPLDLGGFSDSYIKNVDEVKGRTVLSLIRVGELIPKGEVTDLLKPDFTSLRFAPKLKPVLAIKPGAWVSIWQVVEAEDGFQPERLIARALVTQVISEEGLFASADAEVELSMALTDSSLVIAAISSEVDVYLLPVL